MLIVIRAARAALGSGNHQPGPRSAAQPRFFGFQVKPLG